MKSLEMRHRKAAVDEFCLGYTKLYTKTNSKNL